MAFSEEELAEEEEHEMAVNLVLALFVACLVAGAIVTQKLRRTSLHWFPEAGVYLLIGILIGGCIRLGDDGRVGGYLESVASFDSELFFLLLLPPIIFESGYSLKRGFFFRNFGAICTLAFLGTSVATAITGALVWLAGEAGFVYRMTFLDSLIYGALISAVDPVTVLAVFSELGAEPHLYALVFGESVLNDAVSIVLYTTLVTFQTHAVTASSVAGACGLFAGIFVGALAIGVGCAMVSALLFKHMQLYREENAVLERTVVFATPYVAYFVAEGLHLSGIVSILFCGIAMAHYARPNMSATTRDFSHRLFKLLAGVMESIVFIYLGAGLFTYPQAFGNMGFVFYAFVVLLAARAINVGICSFLINRSRPPERRLNSKVIGTLWFSGLRGGIAFALAAGAEHDLKDAKTAKVIETSTIITVIIGVLGIGSGVTPLMHKLDLFDKGEHMHKPLEEEGEEEEEEEEGGESSSEGDDDGYRRTDEINDAEAVRRLDVSAGGAADAGDVEMAMLPSQEQPAAEAAAAGLADSAESAESAPLAAGGFRDDGDSGGRGALVAGMEASSATMDQRSAGGDSGAGSSGARRRRARRSSPSHVASRERSLSMQDAELLASDEVPAMVKFDRLFVRPRFVDAARGGGEVDREPTEGEGTHRHRRHRRHSRGHGRGARPPRHSAGSASVTGAAGDAVIARDLASGQDSASRGSASRSSPTGQDTASLGGESMEEGAQAMRRTLLQEHAEATAAVGPDDEEDDDSDVRRQNTAPAALP